MQKGADKIEIQSVSEWYSSRIKSDLNLLASFIKMSFEYRIIGHFETVKQLLLSGHVLEQAGTLRNRAGFPATKTFPSTRLEKILSPIIYPVI